jgi:hypothetical protein
VSKATEARYKANDMIDEIAAMLADIALGRTEGSHEYSESYRTSLLEIIIMLRKARREIA